MKHDVKKRANYIIIIIIIIIITIINLREK
jgi:hypothetical protein